MIADANNTADPTPSPAAAHAAVDDRVSRMANVRTTRRSPRSERMETRITKELKNEFFAKATKEGKVPSELVVTWITDYVAGSFRVKRQRFGHGARQLQAAELRQLQAQNQKLLEDVAAVVAAGDKSPITTAAVEQLLRDCLAVSRATFARLC